MQEYRTQRDLKLVGPACERWLKTRGQGTLSLREAITSGIREQQRGRRQRNQEERVEEAAEDIERGWEE